MSEAAALKNVAKTYSNGTTALFDVSIQLHEGECLALLGRNGAGKTTTIKILTGLLVPDHGEVWVRGNRFFPQSSEQKLFGVALQEVGLWPYLTILETLRFVGHLYNLEEKHIEKKISELVADFELREHESKRIETLSEGLKRRVNLVCALVHDPPIVVLDEPSLGLDIHARHSLWGYLEKLKERGMTLLLSTHDMEEAARLGDRLGIIEQGKILAYDSLENLKSKYGDVTLENLFLQLTDKSLKVSAS